mmetsp:Transcript_106178/g.285567  ORF Transcript_106178/g.285567 Transcript_106178/m.285567 type:complete len:233 (-) Transcript_106178:18-716(-)
MAAAVARNAVLALAEPRQRRWLHEPSAVRLPRLLFKCATGSVMKRNVDVGGLQAMFGPEPAVDVEDGNVAPIPCTPLVIPRSIDVHGAKSVSSRGGHQNCKSLVAQRAPWLCEQRYLRRVLVASRAHGCGRGGLPTLDGRRISSRPQDGQSGGRVHAGQVAKERRSQPSRRQLQRNEANQQQPNRTACRPPLRPLWRRPPRLRRHPNGKRGHGGGLRRAGNASGNQWPSKNC